MILKDMDILLQNPTVMYEPNKILYPQKCIFVYYKVYNMRSTKEHKHLITWRYNIVQKLRTCPWMWLVKYKSQNLNFWEGKNICAHLF
jgi:hypothetical protein